MANEVYLCSLSGSKVEIVPDEECGDLVQVELLEPAKKPLGGNFMAQTGNRYWSTMKHLQEVK